MRIEHVARQRIEALEQMLAADLQDHHLDRDAGWEPDQLREDMQEVMAGLVYGAIPMMMD